MVPRSGDGRRSRLGGEAASIDATLLETEAGGIEWNCRMPRAQAIGSLLAGILCTLLPSGARAAGFATPTAALLGAAVGMALVTGFMMGVDFPGSNRRFSRLAPADD